MLAVNSQLDRERYRYRAFISDISGQDIREHRDNPLEAIRVVRNWLKIQRPSIFISGGKVIEERYKAFRCDLPELCWTVHLEEDELLFTEFSDLTFQWLARNQPSSFSTIEESRQPFRTAGHPLWG